MDVPADILEVLKCHQCDMYLSRGPVYLEHGGTAACGRCFAPERPATRNKEYEAVAKLLRFPCKNKDLGCGETVAFGEIAHEAICKYRQYVCPVLHCEWLGPRSQLLQHYRAQHPDHVLDNPCSLEHDITTSSLHSYVLQAYQLLFVLFAKVCVTSGKIYHSVRLLDAEPYAEDMAKDFTYTLNIKRNNVEVTKRDDVAPPNYLELQEPTALDLDINSLLNVLGGWGGASCTVEVERRGRKRRWQSVKEETVEVKEETVKVKEEQQECSRCSADVTVMLYRDEGGWRCERCAPARRACENQAQGCAHQDIPDKCGKHEWYFCQQGSRCNICNANVSGGTLFTHFTSHATHSAGSTWRATWTDRLQCCLVACPAGTALCEYWLDDSEFNLNVYTTVSSEQLCEFRCEVRVTQLSTGLTRTYTPDVTYKSWYDWRIEINKQDFPKWNCEFDISVTINQI